jgi:hypothetical protein
MLDTADTLAEIEAIKQLKARYCRYLDTKRWDDWRQLFTDNFVSDTSPAGGKLISGADEFVAFVRGTLGKPSQPTAHQVHAPEIELTSEMTATGVWALQDVVRLSPGINLLGHGHYHETYEKVAAVAELSLSRSTATTVWPRLSRISAQRVPTCPKAPVTSVVLVTGPACVRWTPPHRAVAAKCARRKAD